METEKVTVSTKKVDYDAVLNSLEEQIDELGLTKKDALHARLLAEETIGMLRSMAGDYNAVFWYEQDGDARRLRVTAKAENIGYTAKKELLSVSKSGENALAKGFMGKLGDIITNSLLNYDEVMTQYRRYSGSTGVADFAFMGLNTPEILTWSLEQYRYNIDNDDEVPAQAKDELEKSIVANLAKDVIVGVKKDVVEMTVLF